MSYFRYFLSYPTSPTTYSDEVEMTDYVIEGGSSNIDQKLDNNEYDVGTLKFNKFQIKLTNQDSSFDEAVNQFSIFTFKRDESILRIQWEMNPNGVQCGSTACGYSYLSLPSNIYEGLLEDNSSKFDERSQTQVFTFLGMESIIGKTQTPFSSLLVSDDIETTIFKILNQDKITRLLTVEQVNISVNYNFTPDDISGLENTTSLEALNDLLLLSGSVLYVKDRVVYVKPRDIGATSKATFHGKASDTGIENIVELNGLTSGLNRTFNFWQWGDSSATQSFADSIENYGFRKKSLSYDLVTNTTKQTAILNAQVSEFGFPKREMEITIPMYTDYMENVFLLDKVNLNIPIETALTEDGALPARYGSAIYGESRYIRSNSSLVVSPDVNWKIMNRTISIKSKTIKYRIREE